VGYHYDPEHGECSKTGAEGSHYWMHRKLGEQELDLNMKSLKLILLHRRLREQYHLESIALAQTLTLFLHFGKTTANASTPSSPIRFVGQCARKAHMDQSSQVNPRAINLVLKPSSKRRKSLLAVCRSSRAPLPHRSRNATVSAVFLTKHRLISPGSRDEAAT